MKTLQKIRLNQNPCNHKAFLFPDQQPHVQVSTDSISEVYAPDGIEVIAPIRNSQEIMNLLLLSNALDHMFVKKASLVIPYLMGARSDRVMQPGDSFDLEVMAELINSCNFERVNLFDAHSDVATALIKRSKNHNNSRLVKTYDKDDAVLIVPDAGAVKKVSKYLEWNPKIKHVVNCIKERDLADKGKITLSALAPMYCQDRHCVIIDDLCDGGGTFNMIAEDIKKQGYTPKSMTLIVSHGIFSKGFDKLAENFDEIITSDSYASEYNIFKEYTSAAAAINAYPGVKLTVVPLFRNL